MLKKLNDGLASYSLTLKIHHDDIQHLVCEDIYESLMSYLVPEYTKEDIQYIFDFDEKLIESLLEVYAYYSPGYKDGDKYLRAVELYEQRKEYEQQF